MMRETRSQRLPLFVLAVALVMGVAGGLLTVPEGAAQVSSGNLPGSIYFHPPAPPPPATLLWSSAVGPGGGTIPTLAMVGHPPPIMIFGGGYEIGVLADCFVNIDPSGQLIAVVPMSAIGGDLRNADIYRMTEESEIHSPPCAIGAWVLAENGEARVVGFACECASATCLVPQDAYFLPCGTSGPWGSVTPC